MTGHPRAAAWLTLLGAAILALRLAAVGDLAPPPLTSVDAVERWVDVRGPVATALALVRFGSELAAWYLLGLSLLHLLAHVVRIRGVFVLADALALRGVKRLVHTALGVGLVVTGSPVGDDPTRAPVTPTLERVPDAPSGAVVQERIDAGTATMRPVDEPATPGTAWMTPVPRPADADEVHRADPDAARPTAWRVDPGDSFWSIAEEVLTGSWSRVPTEAEIDPFWRALVDANRHRLVTDDPDLVVPGQVFEIPPVPDP